MGVQFPWLDALESGSVLAAKQSPARPLQHTQYRHL